MAYLAFIAGFKAHPSQTMEQNVGESFKRKYQSLVCNHQYDGEPAFKKARVQAVSEIERQFNLQPNKGQITQNVTIHQNGDTILANVTNQNRLNDSQRRARWLALDWKVL